MALGKWNDEEGKFEVRSVFPASFVQEGADYDASVKLPSNSIDTAMALSFPTELEVESVEGDRNFEEAYKATTYVAWRAFYPMSQISGSVRVALVNGGSVDLVYSFT